MSTPATSPLGTLTLLHLPGLDPDAGAALVRHPGSLQELRESGFLPAITASYWDKAFATARQILDQAERLGVRVLTASSPDYPPLLRQIADRPPVLYVKGTLPTTTRTVACVGTREPSAFGRHATKAVTEGLAAQGWAIVSGLARGIDTLAHQAALRALGSTVAVLANGLDTVYPREHDRLAMQIVEQGGALVSEQPFKAPASAQNLTRRNRIQSGMALATIPFQTDLVGGTMHTVRFAILQGRSLFVPVPQGAHAQKPKSRGICAMTRTGPEFAEMVKAEGAYKALLHKQHGAVAAPIRSIRQLLEALEGLARPETPQTPATQLSLI